MNKFSSLLFILLFLSQTACNRDTALFHDPALEGEWMGSVKNNHRFVFNSDSTFYFGTVDIPYYLEDSGNTLNINNTSYYSRQTGNTSSIVGHWRDDANGEEIFYRTDGRYILIFDNDKFVYYGNYNINQGLLTSYEYRSLYETNANQITFHYLNSLPTATVNYSISANLLTMARDTYIKVP